MPCRSGNECNFLHLCTNFVIGECRFGPRCRYSHDVRDSHNQPIVERCNIQCIMYVDDDVLLELIRYSNLSACSAHVASEGQLCCDPDSCLKLHVCIEFLRNKCLLDEFSCEHGHNLYDGRNKTLLSVYGMLKGPMTEQKEQFLFRRILKPSMASGAPNANGHTKSKPPYKRASKSSKASSSITGSYSDEVDDFSYVDKKTIPTLNKSEVKVALNNLMSEIASATEVYPDVHLHDGEINSLNTNAQAAEVSHSVYGKGSQWASPSTATPVHVVSCEPLTSSCGQFEKHLCDNTSACTVVHGSAPSLWRICLKENWIQLEDSSAIEKAFSDPQNTSFCTYFRKVCIFNVNFYITVACLARLVS